MQYIFKDYGKNVRYVYFFSWGKGCACSEEAWRNRFNQGYQYSGPKFTKANVQLFYPHDTHLDNYITQFSQEQFHKGCLNHCKFFKELPNYKANKKIYRKIYLK